MNVRIFLSIVLFVAGCLTLRGQDNSELTRAEIAVLVDALASPNRPPRIDENDAVWPEDFDRVKQERVHAAYERLSRVGSPSFPFLIERMDDKRYCMTVSYAADVNLTVSDICWDLMARHVHPFGRGTADSSFRGKRTWRPDYLETFLSDGKAKMWWETNKTKTLHQVQLEVVDWIISEEAKDPPTFVEKEQQAMRAIRADLIQGRKPIAHGLLSPVMPKK